MVQDAQRVAFEERRLLRLLEGMGSNDLHEPDNDAEEDEEADVNFRMDEPQPMAVHHG